MSWANAARSKTRTHHSREVRQACDRPFIIPAEVDWDRLVSLDFETYWDQDYTLSKLSTSEYIRDPRFKAQMVGIKIGRGKTRCIPAAKIKAELQKINWKTHSVLCHNIQFDGFILSHHYNIIPVKYYCTLAMARGLHSNEIGGGLDAVSVFYGGAGKIKDVLEDTKGVLNWSKELFLRVVPYCANDVDEMRRIFGEMYPKMPAKEMELIHMTARMFCAPVLKVDIPRVEKELVRELDRRKELFKSVIDIRANDNNETLKTKAERALTGEERDMLIVKRVIGSNEKFADLIRAVGIEPPVKISPAWMKLKGPERQERIDDKWTYAFAKDDLAFVGLPALGWEAYPDLDPNNKGHLLRLVARQARLQQLYDVRVAVKSTTNVTRAERFLKAGANGMKLPCGYAYFRAHTGRWGGNNKMNMQNLTRGGELRLSIIADKGHQIAVVDSGQIEARVNGWLWGQDDLLDAFRDGDAGTGADAYCRFASLVYGKPITKTDKDERFLGKVCVLGLGYQMGAAKFQLTLAKGALGGKPINLPLDQCQGIVNTYRRANDRIVQGWEMCKEIIEQMAAGIPGSYKCISWEQDTIWLPNGLSLKYPKLKKEKDEESGWDQWKYLAGTSENGVETWKKIYGGLLCENLVQALARIIVAEQMLMIDKKYPVVMTTHDEAVAHPKKAVAQKCYDWMHKCFTTPLDWCSDIPLNAEGGFADNYSK